MPTELGLELGAARSRSSGYVPAARVRWPPMSEPRTFDVQLVQPDGAIGAGGYASQNGEVPAVDEVIPVDEHGGCARVTELNGELIRAELVD